MLCYVMSSYTMLRACVTVRHAVLCYCMLCYVMLWCVCVCDECGLFCVMLGYVFMLYYVVMPCYDMVLFHEMLCLLCYAAKQDKDNQCVLCLPS